MASSEGPSSAAEPAPKSSNGVGGNGPNGSAQHANGLLPGPPLTTTMVQGSFISRVRQHSFIIFSANCVSGSISSCKASNRECA